MSVMEVSHRGKAVRRVRRRSAEATLREVMGIPDNYKCLFLQGGAFGEFAAIPLNLSAAGQTIDFLNTGHWSAKAITEAKKYVDRQRHRRREGRRTTPRCPPPARFQVNPDAAYLHYTPNETIRGVEFGYIPDTGDVPLVADMSSTILSRPDRRVEVRPDLRRRPEEHGPLRPVRGHRARRPARQGPSADPDGVGLHAQRPPPTRC